MIREEFDKNLSKVLDLMSQNMTVNYHDNGYSLFKFGFNRALDLVARELRAKEKHDEAAFVLSLKEE